MEESSSPWISPTIQIWKKDGSWRFCVGYRKLNAVTKKENATVFKWNLDCQESFKKLKKALASTIILAFRLPIEKESHTETQMICPDDYVRRYNVVIVLSKQRTMKERTNLVDKIVFEYEKFRNWSDWQRKDETSSIILKAKKRSASALTGATRQQIQKQFCVLSRSTCFKLSRLYSERSTCKVRAFLETSESGKRSNNCNLAEQPNPGGLRGWANIC
ncbi:hypothetical protein HZH66_013706 [Vespula vulgaris]|uniref:Uncharacterized protein n=1 Tax=Vespula vulgaris TaxID=7454 RepID=A0A834J8A4_VESVU|nr:hypothetical protein HZH66_013706 [Vespula vulgaris]